MKKLLLSSLLVTGVVIAAVRVDFAVNPEHRVAVLEGLCKAGLPNLSVPSGANASEWGCSIFGPLRQVSGFVDLAGEPRLLVIGDRYRSDDQGRLENEVVQLTGDLGAVRPPPPPNACLGGVVAVSVEGWAIQSADQPQGGPRVFLLHRVLSIPPVEPGAVLMRRNYEGQYGCVWGGGEGWISLAPPTPDP